MLAQWENPAVVSSIPLLIEAATFAAEKHRDQRRKDAAASPYINHPLAVARILTVEAGITDLVVITAALLHDTIEDTKTTEAELRERFGDEVTKVVLEVTDEKSLPKARRKQLQIEHAPQLTPAAKLVKLADKLCNLRDIIDHPPSAWPAERCAAYVVWTAAVVAGLRGINAPLEAAFDAEQARWATARAW